jgi:putative addiction module component (TIGR02574 family)
MHPTASKCCAGTTQRIRLGHLKSLPSAAESRKFVGMPITVDQIVEETRSLPKATVVELIERIHVAIHGEQEPAHKKAWSKTIHRRIAEIRSGKVEGIPGEVTAAKIRRIVGR